MNTTLKINSTLAISNVLIELNSGHDSSQIYRMKFILGICISLLSYKKKVRMRDNRLFLVTESP